MSHVASTSPGFPIQATKRTENLSDSAMSRLDKRPQRESETWRYLEAFLCTDSATASVEGGLAVAGAKRYCLGDFP